MTLRTRDTIRLGLAAGMLFGLGAVVTTAAWTDQATATSGTFSVGTIDLKLSGADNNPATFATAFTATAMAPGTTVSAALVVQNAGTIPFTYTMSGTATNNASGAIGDVLALEVRPGTCPSAAANVVTTGKLTFGAVAMGPLAASGTQTLCFKATLPSGAASTLQSTSTTATFTFVATSS